MFSEEILSNFLKEALKNVRKVPLGIIVISKCFR